MNPDLKDHRPVLKAVTIEFGHSDASVVRLGSAVSIRKIDPAVFRKTRV
jgi:hypothetical protein